MKAVCHVLSMVLVLTKAGGCRLLSGFYTGINPACPAVELYATTLHYAPCSGKLGDSFRVIIVLPKGTNSEKPDIEIKNDEDKRLFARNKWLIAHPESSEADNGAVVCLKGENIDIAELI